MNDDYKIELFVFPDGTAVEMIVFDGAGDGHSRAAASETLHEAPCHIPPTPLPRGDDDAEVRVCPVCGGGLVYPVDWQRCGEAAWNLELRCPDCETRREVTLGRAAVEQFNRDLYHGAQTIAREAAQMMRRNFEDEAEKILVALERDLILPMDF